MEKITLTVSLWYPEGVAPESVVAEVWQALREYRFPSFEVALMKEEAGK